MSSSNVEIPGYNSIELVGTGGIGRVYRAVRVSTGTYVAIKVLNDVEESSVVWTRVRRELEALASLKGHANVVQIEEIIESASGPLLVMEYAPGGSVLDLIRASGGKMEIAEAIFVCKQVAEALVAAHSIGVVHRDIKPQNLLVSSFGQIKVCDFGISALGWSEEFRNHTSALSYRYASPEELDGETFVDSSTDVYSLGATFVHCLAGRPPSFGGRDDTGSHRLDEIRGRWPDGIPGESTLIELVRRCLSIIPAKRPTAEEVLDELDGLELLLGAKVRRVAIPTAQAPVETQTEDDLATKVRQAGADDSAPLSTAVGDVAPLEAPGDDMTVVRPRLVEQPPPASSIASPPVAGDKTVTRPRSSGEPVVVVEPLVAPPPDLVAGVVPPPPSMSTTAPVNPAELNSSEAVRDRSHQDDVDDGMTIRRPSAVMSPSLDPSNSRRSFTRVIAGAGAAVVVIVVVFLLATSGPGGGSTTSSTTVDTSSVGAPPDDGPGPTSATTPALTTGAIEEFERLEYPDGTTVDRTWEIFLGDDPRLVGRLVLSAPRKKSARAAHVEVIPKEAAADVSAIDFSEQPSRVIEPDPIVEFNTRGLKAGETREITYVIGLSDVSAAADPQAVLDELVSAQATAQAAYDRAQARRLVSLTITPTEGRVLPLAAVQFSVTATRADGGTVAMSDLDVTWSSSDETLLFVDDAGEATGIGPGAATVTAKVGDLTATANVIIEVPPPPTTIRPPTTSGGGTGGGGGGGTPTGPTTTSIQ